MKLMIASDIHGSAYYCQKMLEAYAREKADRLLILGDILYHGPRNDLPRQYEPKEVISVLNEIKEEIVCVRGNCDTEVDQMVLDFPIMADYCLLDLDGKIAFVTYGHKFNPDNPPMLKNGDILINGHTHIPAFDRYSNYTYINPGSVSIPKAGSEHSYLIYENKRFIFKNLDGEVLREEYL